MPTLKSLVMLAIILAAPFANAQKKRVKPPKRTSNIKSVDAFVENTFELYHKVFVYDSLTQANVDIPAELEDELMQSAEQNIDSLMIVLPVVIEDISNSDTNFGRKAKATLNLNKAKKALRFCAKTSKDYFLGKEEEKEDEEDKKEE